MCETIVFPENRDEPSRLPGDTAALQNPALLQRWINVERLHLRGRTAAAIAHELGISQRLVAADLEAVRALWRERVSDSIVSQRMEKIAEYRYLRQEFLAIAEDQATPHYIRIQALNGARQCIDEEARVRGLLVHKLALTDDAGKPVDFAALLMLARQPDPLPAIETTARVIDEEDDDASGDR